MPDATRGPLVHDLDRVTERLGTLVHAMDDLREENATLRAALAQRDAETQRLRQRVDDARTRVELLIDRLPADA